MQFYTDESLESNPRSLPDAEVFHAEANDARFANDNTLVIAGYYYWYCFPGCLPDSEPYGPFSSKQAAIDDARDNE